MSAIASDASVLHAADGVDARMAHFLAAATRELVGAGLMQTVLYARGAGSPAAAWSGFDPRVRLLEVPQRFGAWPGALRRELRARRYEVVHLHGPRAGLVGRLARAGRSLSSSAAWYYSPHGLASLDAGRRLSAASACLLERLAGRSPCQPVGCGRGEAAELERLTGRPAAVLDAPVDARWFEIQGRPAEPPRVATLGGDADARDAMLFAELAARFHFAGEAARFVWIGAVDSRIGRLLRAADVEVLVPAGEYALHEALAGASLYVQPSLRAGLPRALLEAMSAGLACIVLGPARTGDPITPERTGLVAADIAQLALHVKLLLDDPALAAALGTAAREEARERFHPQHFGRALLALYRLES